MSDKKTVFSFPDMSHVKLGHGKSFNHLPNGILLWTRNSTSVYVNESKAFLREGLDNLVVVTQTHRL